LSVLNIEPDHISIESRKLYEEVMVKPEQVIQAEETV